MCKKYWGALVQELPAEKVNLVVTKVYPLPKQYARILYNKGFPAEKVQIIITHSACIRMFSSMSVCLSVCYQPSSKTIYSIITGRNQLNHAGGWGGGGGGVTLSSM